MFIQILLLVHKVVVSDSILHVWICVFKLVLELVILIEILLVLVLYLPFIVFVLINSIHLIPVIITVLNHFVAHYVLRVG